MSEELTPYRHETTSTHERIALLEKELAALRAGLRTPSDRALAALRVSHLREDRELAAARYRAWRSRAFWMTALAMIGAFAAFVFNAAGMPAAAMYWVVCAVAVSIVAGAGMALQSVIRSSAEARVRTLDRRIAEEVVVAGIEERDVSNATRVRVTTDVLGVEAEDLDPFDARRAGAMRAK